MKSTSHSLTVSIKFLLAFLVGISQAATSQTRDSTAESSISGVVIDSTNSRPIGHAVVIATPEKGGQAEIRGIETEPDGHFVMTHLAPGRYQIVAQKQGFGLPIGRPKVSAEITTEAKTVEVVVQLVPNAAVSGRVSGSDGEPLLGAIVQLSRLQFTNGRFINVPVARAGTNDLGEYRIFGVPPGHYRITGFYRDSASVFGLRRRPAPQDTATDEPQTQDYAVTYYPGTLDADSAVTVRLKPGQTQQGIDIHLVTAPSGSIAGSVSNIPAGTEAVQVLLQPSDSGELGARQSFAVHPGNHRFQFKSLPSGTYVLRVDHGLPEQQLSAREVITVHEAPVNNVNLALRPPIGVRGTVTMTGSTSPAGLVVELVGSDLQNRAAFRVNPDGTFQAPRPLPPDDYSVRLPDAEASLYLKMIAIKGQRINSSTVRIEEPTNMELVVSDKASKVEGVVKDSDEQPVNSCMVILAGTKDVASRAYFSRPDSGGKFALTSVPPGRYSISCLSGLASEQDLSPEMLGKVRASGRDITVEEKQNVSVNLAPSSDESD
jgi:hypothetical protein